MPIPHNMYDRIAATVATIGLVFSVTGCLNNPPKQSGVFVTHDAGTSWTSSPDLKARGAKKVKVYPALDVNAVGASAQDGNQVVAGTDDDLYQSSNGGKNWEKITDRLPSSTKAMTVQQVVFHPTQQNTYFAVGVSGGYGKVIKTTDYGKTLQDVFTNSKPGQSVTAITISQANGSIFVGDQLGSVYRSGDGGVSWQRVFSLSNATVTSLALSGSDLFVGTHDQGVWRSADGGTTFAPASGNLPASGGRRVWTMAVGFGGLYAGTDRGLFLTKDFGSTWTSIGNPLPANGQRVQAVTTSGANVFFATNAVVYRMDPSGNAFVPVQLKLARNVFSLVPAGRGGSLYAGAKSQGSNYTDRYASGLQGFGIQPPGQPKQ